MLDAALRKDVVIYTIGIYEPGDNEANPRLLRQLADATGGEAFFPRADTDVMPLLERIASHWGPAERTRDVTWALNIRVGRVE